jgi:hypothetical protein
MLMRIFTILIIPILSLLISLLCSGIENIITADNHNWENVPFYYWLMFWSVSLYTFYRIKFSTYGKLKFVIFRLIIKLRDNYLSAKVFEKSSELNSMQKAAIETWKNLLRDKKTTLSSCLYTHRRMLTNGDVTCIISTQGDTNLIYFRAGKSSAYYDVWLPNSILVELYTSYDKEQRIRFQKLVEEARNTMVKVINV